MPWLFGIDWDEGHAPFPRLLRWALVAAPLALVAGWIVPYSTSDVVRGVKILFWAVSGLCALFAVPTAVFALVFRPHYRNGANLLMTLIAAIPFALATFVILILVAGWVTGGNIH